MTLAIDTKHLLEVVIPNYENTYNRDINRRVDRGGLRRLQLQRVCVYGIVTHDAAARAQFDRRCGESDSKQKAALEWQAEQGDDEDEVEVLHHLKQLAATTTSPGVGSSRRGSGGVQSRAGTTSLVASVQNPTFTLSTQRSSSFRRYSTRHIQESRIGDRTSKLFCNSFDTWDKSGHAQRHNAHHGGTDLKRVVPNMSANRICLQPPKIVSQDAAGARRDPMIWLLQLDFFDISSQGTCSPSSSRKRRRTLNPFHHVSPSCDEDHTARAQHRPVPEAKRFKGVRFRADHNRWVAEMKPPKSKNKVSFGEFRSQTDAARVVDVAFHHYGRPLNFPDSTPRLLSSLPPSTGLSGEAKLELVREQIEWMKPRVSSLPSRDCSTSDANSELRPFSAIGSSLILVGSDEADDAVSQPQPGWLQALMSSVGMAEGHETWGVADGSGDGPQRSLTQWSVETAGAHDPSADFGISPKHFGGARTGVASSQAMDFGGSATVDNSAAPSVFPMWSPGAFQMEAVDGRWEQEIAAVGRDSGDQVQA